MKKMKNYFPSLQIKWNYGIIRMLNRDIAGNTIITLLEGQSCLVIFGSLPDQVSLFNSRAVLLSKN